MQKNTLVTSIVPKNHTTESNEFDKNDTKHMNSDHTCGKRSSNQVVVIVLSVLTMVILWSVSVFLLYTYFLPYIFNVYNMFQTFLDGKEHGTRCSLWNQSPIQHLKCTIVNGASNFIMSGVIGIYTDMQRVQSYSTLFAGIGSVLYTLYVILWSSFQKFGTFFVSINVLAYTKIHKTYYNPYLPFDYIENVVRNHEMHNIQEINN